MKSTTRLKYVIILLFAGFSVSAQTIEGLEFGTDSTLELVTWNIEWFPKNGQLTIDYVIDIIETMDVDLLAIQEVDDVSQFEQMIQSMGSYNGYLESSYFAGLAYIYKPDVIQINDIYEIYTTQPYWSPFPRSPMLMDFTYNNERIVIINNHFKCCGDGILDPDNPDDEETRRHYASTLLKEYIDTNLPHENVIVIGDLNDVLSDFPQNNVFQMFLDDGGNYLFTDYDIAMGPESEWSYPTWPSHLDHILITDELFDDFENEASLVSTIKVDEHLSGGWWEYEENVSDHRPVALKLDMNSNTGLNDIALTRTYFSNYPQPFGSKTNFSFQPQRYPMNIEIINTHGQTVFFDEIAPGTTSSVWQAIDCPNGIYLASLKSKNKVLASLKLMLTK